ncbi:hypothetical protein SAMN05518670_2074 [Paenibacillus sp. OK076]|nr:hypothetical protein SAMN05518670_2074 [Paenibacillus sp. OK076]
MGRKSDFQRIVSQLLDKINFRCCQSKRIVYNWSHIKIFKCFLGFRDSYVGLVREKTHSLLVVSRRDKSLGDELL